MIALLIATVFVISACNSSGEAARKVITANINANECSADDTCEMNSAIIPIIKGYTTFEDGFYVNGGDVKYLNNTDLITYKGGVALGAYTMNNTEHVILRILNYESNNRKIIVNAPAQFREGLHIDDGVLSVDSLQGDGNAFACLDDDGKLYRSNTSCN